MEVITYRIREIGEVIGGGTPKTNVPEFWNGDIPWLSPADLTGYTNVYISHGANNISNLGYQKSRAKLMPKGAVLMSSRAPIGYLAIANNEICTNQGFKSIVCNETIVDNKYLYYYLKQNLNQIRAFSNGATFPEISGNQLKKIKITIPKNVEIQKKISKILFEFDCLIENNNKRIELLQKVSEFLYKEWFVRFRYPGHCGCKMKFQSVKGWTFGDQEGGLEIPEDWKLAELNEIAEFKRGKNITSSEMSEGVVPVISAGIEPSGYHNQANVEGCSLTISASGANAGYLAYHLEDIWAADCSYYKNNKNIWFVYNALKFLQPVVSNMQVGSAQPHVYAKNINRISTIIPANNLIEMYCEKVNPLYKEIKILKEKNILLAKQRDSLLPRLMSGKLSVVGKEVI